MQRLVLFFLGVIVSWFCCMGTISPLDFGLQRAKTGIERYYVLQRTHKAAVERGCRVSYKGVKQIEIEIPEDGTSIPLSYYTDFAGTKIIVHNKTKKIPLFVLQQELKEIHLKKEQLSSGNYRNCPELRSGRKLIVVEDQERWVQKRAGYNNGATRKDILLLKRGHALNRVISSYDDAVSKPKFYWCNASNRQTVIKNMVFERSSDSEVITFLLSVSNLDDVYLKNIKIFTPENNELYADAALKFENCTNVVLEDVEINGTYSLVNKYGYGIGMNNVWNSMFIRLKGYGKWGIFGNNNINTVTITDSDINRFDIHCYGRDVLCKNTVFRNMYNQFSSFYGTLQFENCKFIQSIPVLFESSYSAYSFFNLEFKDCYIETSKDCPYLIKAGNPAKLAEKPRGEFDKVFWPNIRIENLSVALPDGVNKWTLFYVTGGNGEKIYGISDIIIEGLEIESKEKKSKVFLTNTKLQFEKRLNIRLSNSSIPKIE